MENVGKAPADAGRETFRAEILGGVAQFMEEIKSLFIVRAGRQPLDVEKNNIFLRVKQTVGLVISGGHFQGQSQAQAGFFAEYVKISQKVEHFSLL